MYRHCNFFPVLKQTLVIWPSCFQANDPTKHAHHTPAHSDLQAFFAILVLFYVPWTCEETGLCARLEKTGKVDRRHVSQIKLIISLQPNDGNPVEKWEERAFSSFPLTPELEAIQ